MSDAIVSSPEWAEPFVERCVGTIERHAVRTVRVSAYLAAGLVVAPLFYHLAVGSQAFLGLFEDDYFYYAIIADKLVTLGKLTYDGTTLTNGFHPLWFLIVAALRAALGRFGPSYYIALAVISLGSVIATYELGRRFARALGAREPVSTGIGSLYLVGTGRLLTSGMECTIAVPLLLWMLLEIARDRPLTTGRAAKLGFIASLAVLARLDIALAVALVWAGYWLLQRPPLWMATRYLAAFCAGGALVAVYALGNLAFFGSLLPTSAAAKQLQTSAGFSLTYLQRAALGTVYGPSIFLVVAAGVGALTALVVTRRRERPHARFAGGIALLFPLVLFLLNARTGWTFFGWYAYPLAAASIAALAFAAAAPRRWPRTWVFRLSAVAVLVLLPPTIAFRYFIDHGPRWSVADNSLLAMSYELANRVGDRTGLFAMGAIAGVATYVLDKPVLQLEGIVADYRLIEHVKHQDPLPDVLRAYGVDYLIVALIDGVVPDNEGCYLVTQPHSDWAGHRTPKIRGRICSPPIVRFSTARGPNPWSRFTALETLVWDLRTAIWVEPNRHVSLPSKAPLHEQTVIDARLRR